MKTEWNYTDLAKAYLQRAEYASTAIDHLLAHTNTGREHAVCDVGAGVAHLTLQLARTGARIDAVEPNDAMRELGQQRTLSNPNVQWFEGVGENTSRTPNTYHLVTFGSSFNVVDRDAALIEVRRIAVAQGWFACMWNHRDISDPLQTRIEQAIHSVVPEYQGGLRREDQTEYLRQSGHFETLDFSAHSQSFVQTADELVEAWRSHATLQRQAGGRFERAIQAISDIARSADRIVVPYVTRMWIGQLR